MYAQKDASSPAAKRLRKRGGAYIKRCREAADLTQRELAGRVGLEYYTFISQIENGTGRPPPHLYEDFARALGIPTRDFVKKMLMFYDPFVYKALFGVPTNKDLK